MTASTSLDVNDDVVTGEWQILRLEATINGDVRWYIDGVLVRTVVGALSTTTDLSCGVAVEAKTASSEEMNIDYLEIASGRDWTI